MAKRILIADDEPEVRKLLELVLRNNNYEVTSAVNGDQLIRMAQEHVPDLIIVDLMMPQMDGYEAIRQMRNDTRIAHLPMIILTAKSTPGDVVSGFETGADDYITKPFNMAELLARISGHLRRAAQRPVLSPLTGMPGNILLTEEINHRLRAEGLFALLYVDIDNFKAFNDTYGPARGDRAIKQVAEIITEVTREHGSGNDFVGHIGGDDFSVLTTPDFIDPIAREIITRFDVRVRTLYDASDLARGFIEGIDRQGVPRRFPITSISIGAVTNQHRSFASYEDISRVAAEMKRFAKQQPGSTYAIDARAEDGLDIGHERRDQHALVVLVIGNDDALRAVTMKTLSTAGYRPLEAPGLPEMHALLAQEHEIAAVLIDLRLEGTLREMLEVLHSTERPTPIGAIITRERDRVLADQLDLTQRLMAPFNPQQLTDLVVRLVQGEA